MRKGVDLTGLLGNIKEDWGLGDGSPPAGSRGRAPVGSLEDEVPQKLKLFVKLHIIFALTLMLQLGGGILPPRRTFYPFARKPL